MSEGEVVPILTDATPPGERIDGQGAVLNGRTINVRLTHPSLYRLMMLSGGMCIALALNFMLSVPTFLIYSQSNYLWGSIFLLLGVSQIMFLNIRRNLRLVRLSIAASFVYIAYLSFGTMQPFLEGRGSLQLPILYLGWAVLQRALLLEPFINPWTARRDV